MSFCIVNCILKQTKLKQLNVKGKVGWGSIKNRFNYCDQTQ